MRGLTDWFSIFRAERWTSSDGRTRSFGHGDLDQMVETYDAEHPSPCVITHKEVYSPFAFGWVEKIRRRGDVLEGRLRRRHARAAVLEAGQDFFLDA